VGEWGEKKRVKISTHLKKFQGDQTHHRHLEKLEERMERTFSGGLKKRGKIRGLATDGDRIERADKTTSDNDAGKGTMTRELLWGKIKDRN